MSYLVHIGPSLLINLYYSFNLPSVFPKICLYINIIMKNFVQVAHQKQRSAVYAVLRALSCVVASINMLKYDQFVPLGYTNFKSYLPFVIANFDIVYQQ